MFFPVKVVYYCKKKIGWATILAIFFTNSSGHPAYDVKDVTRFQTNVHDDSMSETGLPDGIPKIPIWKKNLRVLQWKMLVHIF
jgi:hypothetical protein